MQCDSMKSAEARRCAGATIGASLFVMPRDRRAPWPGRFLADGDRLLASGKFGISQKN
jgi:hypothetical protein